MDRVYIKIDPYSVDTQSTPVDKSYIQNFHNWKSQKKGKGLTVAVVDTGVDDSHPLLENIEVEHQNFASNAKDLNDAVGHGTACAGLIAENCPLIEKIINVRIFGSEGRTSGQALMEAYEFLIENAQRIDLANFSIGTSRKSNPIDSRHKQLISKGVRTVTASGNSGADSGGSPASAEGAISVGALTKDGELTDFSSSSKKFGTPSICALGKDIRLARATNTSMGEPINSRYTKASGTSFACPIMLAAIGNYMGEYSSFTKEDFIKTANDIPETGRDGAGVLDLSEALDAGRAESDTDDSSTESSMYVGPYGNRSMIWLKTRFPQGSYKVSVTDSKIQIIE